MDVALTISREDSQHPTVYEYGPIQRRPATATTIPLGSGVHAVIDGKPTLTDEPPIYTLVPAAGATWGAVARGDAAFLLVRGVGAPEEEGDR